MDLTKEALLTLYKAFETLEGSLTTSSSTLDTLASTMSTCRLSRSFSGSCTSSSTWSALCSKTRSKLQGFTHYIGSSLTSWWCLRICIISTRSWPQCLWCACPYASMSISWQSSRCLYSTWMGFWRQCSIQLWRWLLWGMETNLQSVQWVKHLWFVLCSSGWYLKGCFLLLGLNSLNWTTTNNKPLLFFKGPSSRKKWRYTLQGSSQLKGKFSSSIGNSRNSKSLVETFKTTKKMKYSNWLRTARKTFKDIEKQRLNTMFWSVLMPTEKGPSCSIFWCGICLKINSRRSAKFSTEK